MENQNGKPNRFVTTFYLEDKTPIFLESESDSRIKMWLGDVRKLFYYFLEGAFPSFIRFQDMENQTPMCTN